MTAVHRVDYAGEGLSEAELAPTPWQQATRWVEEADARAEAGDDVPEPRALSVATVDPRGRRTSAPSSCGSSTSAAPGSCPAATRPRAWSWRTSRRVAAALVWPAMYRAIRFRGVVEEVGADEVREYWASRPWGSRISAWASRQSEPATGRDQLEADFDRYADAVPRPRSAGRRAGPRVLGRLPRAVPGGGVLGRAGATGCTTGWCSAPSAPAGERRPRTWPHPRAWTTPRRGRCSAASPEPGAESGPTPQKTWNSPWATGFRDPDGNVPSGEEEPAARWTGRTYPRAAATAWNCDRASGADRRWPAERLRYRAVTSRVR